MNIDTARYTTDQIAAAAGVSVETLSAQIRRGDLALAPSELPELRQPGQGRTRYWSARRALSCALTQELALVGLSIKQASKLALLFTDAGGDPGASILGSAPADTGWRLPGQLYADGTTIMRVLFKRGTDPVAVVERLEDIHGSPFTIPPGQIGTAVAMVDLTALVGRTLASLGLRS